MVLCVFHLLKGKFETFVNFQHTIYQPLLSNFFIYNSSIFLTQQIGFYLLVIAYDVTSTPASV